MTATAGIGVTIDGQVEPKGSNWGLQILGMARLAASFSPGRNRFRSGFDLAQEAARN